MEWRSTVFSIGIKVPWEGGTTGRQCLAFYGGGYQISGFVQEIDNHEDTCFGFDQFADNIYQ